MKNHHGKVTLTSTNKSFLLKGVLSWFSDILMEVVALTDMFGKQ